jgi:hypothetical protein
MVEFCSRTLQSEHMKYKIYVHYQLRESYIEKNSILKTSPSKPGVNK